MYMCHDEIIAAENDNFTGKTCPRCSKQFSRHTYVKQHILICKGVTNSLECPFCKKVCSSLMSKSRHIKKCFKKTEMDRLNLLRGKYDEDKNTKTTPSSGSSVRPGKIGKKAEFLERINQRQPPKVIYNEFETEFDFSHITCTVYRKSLSEITNFLEYFTVFITLLFKNKENRCFRKIKKAGEDIEVYTEDGWTTMVNVSAKTLTTVLASIISDFLNSISRDDRFISSINGHRYMARMADYVAGESCNDDVHVSKFKECQRGIPKRILDIFFKMTSETDA